MNPEISIVVPVYNVGEYLERCLLSIQNQTFEDFEVICVNDGSLDNSLDILNAFSKKDKRFKVYSKKNEGLSETRNFGVRKSTGKYILFIDSDDWISELMLEELYLQAIRENADIVMCGYSREYGGRSLKKFFGTYFEKEKQVFEGEEVHTFLQRRLIGPIGEEVNQLEHVNSMVTAWAKLYKKNIVNKIDFIDTQEIGTEDALYNIMVFSNAKKVVWLDKPLYHYWKGNDTSLTTRYNAQLFEKWVNLFEYMNEFIQKNSNVDFFEVALKNRIWMSTLILAMNEFTSDNKSSFKEKNKRYKQIISSDVIENAFEYYDSSLLSLKWKVFFGSVRKKNVLMVYFLVKTIDVLKKIK